MLGIKPLLTKISDPLIIRPVCLWVKGGVELDQMAGGRTWKSQTSSEGELRMSGCVPNMFGLHHLPWEEFPHLPGACFGHGISKRPHSRHSFLKQLWLEGHC